MILFIILSTNLSLSYAIDLTIPNSTTTFSLYRAFFGPAGVPTDFYTSNSQRPDVAAGGLLPFPGWQTIITPAGVDATLVITPDPSSDAGCTFLSVPQTSGDPTYTETVFSIESNGHVIVLNPDIPLSFFHSNPPANPLHCTANIKAVSVVNGQKIASKPVQIHALIHAVPPSRDGNRYIMFVSSGLSHLTPQKNDVLPIFLDSLYAPLNAIGRPRCTDIDPICNNGLQADGKSMDLFAVISGSDPSKPLLISAGLSRTYQQEKCYYFPTLSYKDSTGKMITGQQISMNVPDSASTPENAATVHIHWTEFCNLTAKNNMHTISAGVNTKNRFQYGTFQVTMVPSSVSGVNSSFYTFFGDNTIPSSTTKNWPNNTYHWKYTSHEIDFEFVPGTHPLDFPPLFSAYGFNSGYVPKNQIGKTVSLNAFSPRNAMRGILGTLDHHRYCPNTYDPQCLSPSSFDPYDGKAHTFTMTWEHESIKYYFDGLLANVLPIIDRQNGTPIDAPTNIHFMRQRLFNNAAIVDVNQNIHLTSPQFISMNFWVPSGQDNFGGVFADNTIHQLQKIYARYLKVAWSPCVDHGLFETSCAADLSLGKVYDSTGMPLSAPLQKASTWDFTHMDKKQFLQDWMFAPVMGFDNNNSTFVQNNVLLNPSKTMKGLVLCMMNLWDNMAVTGKPSIGCDGNRVVPPPGTRSPTNFHQALLVITATGKKGRQWGTLGEVYRGILPTVPSGPNLELFNGGWDPQHNHACHHQDAVEGYSCGSSNGWFADSRLEKMQNQSYQATFLSYVNTSIFNGKIWTLKPTSTVDYHGHPCRISYEPASITVEPQGTYYIDATVDCQTQ
ncbi:MAG: family 16 glycosylhydrolase [Gammaproteobacteria bacterium]|nr:family 16 glycosylhydrolase [Gammaproteobacteria bacterium]